MYGHMQREKRSLWSDLIVPFQYLKRVYKKGAERLFTRACNDRAWGMVSNFRSRFWC